MSAKNSAGFSDADVESLFNRNEYKFVFPVLVHDKINNCSLSRYRCFLVILTKFKIT